MLYFKLFFHDRCVLCIPLKGFLLIVPKNVKQRFRFLLRVVQFDSAHPADWLQGAMPTAEIDLAVWCTLQSLSQRSDVYCTAFEILDVLESWEVWNNWLCSMMHTAESDFRCDAHGGDWFSGMIHPPGDWLSGVIHTLDIDLTVEIYSTVECTQHSFSKNLNILEKNKKECKNTVACLSGAQMGSNHETNRGKHFVTHSY